MVLHALAQERNLSDSALLQKVEAAPRDARVCVRLRPEDPVLLREWATGRAIPAATYASMVLRALLRAVTPLPDRELTEFRRRLRTARPMASTTPSMPWAIGRRGRLRSLECAVTDAHARVQQPEPPLERCGCGGHGRSHRNFRLRHQASIGAPLSRNSLNEYDELNRLQQITDPASGVTQFGYNANDHLTSVTDPRNLVTSYSYSGFGRSPATGQSRYRMPISTRTIRFMIRRIRHDRDRRYRPHSRQCRPRRGSCRSARVAGSCSTRAWQMSASLPWSCRSEGRRVCGTACRPCF
jgi:YD repeat-containing protein